MTIREHDDLELMSMRRLSDSLEATRTMLLQAQKIAQEAQTALINLAMEFCGQDLQKRPERNEDLNQIPSEELATLLRGRFKTLKLVSTNGAAAKLAEANRTIGELNSEVETQHGRAQHLQEQVDRLERQVQSLELTLENERQVKREVQDQPSPAMVEEGSPSVDTAAHQTWYSAWKRENRKASGIKRGYTTMIPSKIYGIEFNRSQRINLIYQHLGLFTCITNS